MVETTAEMMWHNDGHILHLQINKSELKIIEVTCPFRGNTSSPCSHPEHGCLVEEFAFRYGLDCNVGVCPATSDMSICWTNVGPTTSDIDAMQLWFMPINDDVFSAWLGISQ